MTDREREARIRERLDWITPTPWKAQKHLGCKQVRGRKSGSHRQAQYQTEVCCTPGLHDEDEDRANAKLISHAPSDLRFLLARVERYREALEEIYELSRKWPYSEATKRLIRVSEISSSGLGHDEPAHRSLNDGEDDG